MTGILHRESLWSSIAVLNSPIVANPVSSRVYVHGPRSSSLRALSIVRTGRPGHCRSNQFDTEIDFFQEFLLKNHLLKLVHTIQDLTDLAGEF